MAAIQTLTLIQPNEVVNGGVLKPTPINSRFDVTLIAPHIADAEATHVVPVIGQEFYDALIAAKNGVISNYNTALGSIQKAFPATGDEALETLWNTYLMSLCAWAVYYEALPFIAIQTGTNGVFQTSIQYGENAGTDGVKFLQQSVGRRLKSLSSRIGDFLCKNAADYPDFDNSGCETDCNGKTTTEITSMEDFGLFYSV